MIHQRFWLICTAAFLAPMPARSAMPELVSVEKIWDRGAHNAFTDLIRWRNKWYCTFREADAHVGGDGKLRVLESADGKAWGPGSLIAEEGIDLRDPKLSITPDDRLMIVAGGSVYQGTKTLKGRQPRVAFSTDGREWTAPQRVLSEGDWLWRVTWHDGKAYGISYEASDRDTPAAKDAARTGKVDPGPADWTLKLVVSDDGLKYDLVTPLDVPGHPNESTVRILPDGEMIALVRREGGNTFGWIGSSKPPYTAWHWHETKHRLGGPNFIRLPDGSLWAAGRSYPGGAKTVVARMSRDSYEPALTLPSGGDTSYPGLVWHDGLLWMSYYSSHEGKSAIYLAKIKLPLDAEDIGSRLEPFVDDYLIDRLAGTARLEVQRPEPREVVFTADRPWEGNTSAYYTIFQDGDTYRMYYRGAHYDEATKKAAHPEVTCYAESKDGIAWARPELGLFEFEGSKRNNIVWDGPGAHNFTPFKDTNPGCPAEARYKALARVKGGLIALRSADGIHWERLAESPVITRGAFDSQNLAFWDERAGKYREYHRALPRGPRHHDRHVRRFHEMDRPRLPRIPRGAEGASLYQRRHALPPAPHVLIGFPTRFLPATQQTEPIFMASRDGRVFRRYDEAVIPTTAPQRPRRQPEQLHGLGPGAASRPGSGVLGLRQGGLLHRQGEPPPPVRLSARWVRGPARRRRRGRGRDEAGPVPRAQAGHQLPDRRARRRPGRAARCGRLAAGRVRRVGVPGAARGRRGRDGDVGRGDDVGALAGQAVRIRFVLKDADVFSFRFEE